MVETEEVNPVHKLYMELSSRYKAGWTFHRFLQGLKKFFGSLELEDHTADFQTLYKRLKAASGKLNDPAIQPVIEELEAVRSELATLMVVLDHQDQRVTPSLVRLFFQRVKDCDERIILDLIRFYLEIQRGRSWDPDRVDKADYLLTRLAEAISEPERAGEGKRLRKVLEGLSARIPKPSSTESQKLGNRRRMIEAVREEIGEIRDFEHLTQRDLVGHYRKLKHGLGGFLFERSILPMVVDTNLVVASRVRELTAAEEGRIFKDYEKISRLEEEREVDSDLTHSVSRLHLQVGEFREQIGSGNVRLRDMVQIRSSFAEILDELGGVPEREAPVPEREAQEEAVEVVGWEEPPRISAEILTSKEDRLLVGKALEELIAEVGKSGLPASGESGSGSPASGLGGREMSAFRRLSGEQPCDERLERFVLSAAALRRRLGDEIAEIRARSGGGGDGPDPESIQRLLRLADWYLRQFAHFVETFHLQGEAAEAHELQRLRMSLMREFSNLWLMANG
jgi:hypothetical protein